VRYEAGHKEKTREVLLKETAKALRRVGPHQLGVAKVMASAGLTHGGFYAHFKSRDEMIAEGISRMFEESRSRLPPEDPAAPPKQALKDYIVFYLSAAHRDSRSTGCPLPFLSADAPRLGDESRRRFAGGVEMMRARLEAKLAACGRADAAAESSSLLAELVGALALARAEPDPEASDRILANSMHHLLRRFDLEGLA
jgi:TetR/AcrR family transcriptional repressor of nem operon